MYVVTMGSIIFCIVLYMYMYVFELKKTIKYMYIIKDTSFSSAHVSISRNAGVLIFIHT